MPLRPDFHFNQNNLQDFIDCPRRFELKHFLQLQWPAIQSEPALDQEYRVKLGQRFHQMVHQSLIGIPLESITNQATDPDLVKWWENFLQAGVLEQILGNETKSLSYYPEYFLSIPFNQFRLTAKYDLLVITHKTSSKAASLTIYDWKTSIGSYKHRPSPSYYQNRMQTRVYLYLVIAGASPLDNDLSILPEQVELIYWFPGEPGKPANIKYTQEKFQQDHRYLDHLIDTINQTEKGTFLLTTDVRNCLYCRYRSLCDRGIEAGQLGDNDETGWVDSEESEGDQSSLNIDFNQVGEIPY